MISNPLPIYFIHSDIHVRSCKNIRIVIFHHFFYFFGWWCRGGVGGWRVVGREGWGSLSFFRPSEYHVTICWGNDWSVLQYQKDKKNYCVRFKYADAGIWYVFTTLLRCRLRCWREHIPIETKVVSSRQVVLQIRVFCPANGVKVFTTMRIILREPFFQMAQKHICNIWRELFTCRSIVSSHIQQNI